MPLLGLVWLWGLAPAVQVHWEAPPGCPTASRVRAEVASLVEADVDVQAPAVSGVVRQLDSGRFELELELTDPDGVVDARTLDGETCEAVTEAAALVIALRVESAASEATSTEDPSTVVPEPSGSLMPPTVDRPAEPARPPDETPAEPSDEPPADEASSVVAPASEGAASVRADVDIDRPSRSAWIAVSGGVALGVLPGFGGVVALAGGVEGRRWRVGAHGRGAPARSAAHPDDDAVTGRFDLVTGGVVGCGVPRLQRLAFPLCGRFEVGGVRGVGEDGVGQPRPQWSLWSGVGASAGVGWRVLRWLEPYVQLEGLVGLTRPGFSVGLLPGTLYAMGRLGGRVSVGLHFAIVPRGRSGS